MKLLFSLAVRGAAAFCFTPRGGPPVSGRNGAANDITTGEKSWAAGVSERLTDLLIDDPARGEHT